MSPLRGIQRLGNGAAQKQRKKDEENDPLDEYPEFHDAIIRLQDKITLEIRKE